jgi:hypothetical protein
VISTVFAAIKDRLDAALVAAGQPAIRHELGAWKLPSTGAPNQIVWVVGRGQIKAARQTGQGARAINIRQIATRTERIYAHVWGGGGGFDATERLLNHFLAALRAGCTDYPYRALETDWTIAQEAVTTAGRLCVVTFELDIPVTAEPLAISPAPHTVAVNGTFNH